MTLSSMTGYARVEGVGGDGDRADGFAWIWEMKSVNGKALDLRFRLPPGLDGLEAGWRAQLGAEIARGSIAVSLTLAEGARAPELRINQAVLDQVVGLMGGLIGRIDAAPPRLDGLLALRGVLELVEPSPPDEATRQARQAVLGEGFSRTLAALVKNRLAEGARLAAIIEQRLTEIAGLVQAAEQSAAAQPAAIRARFETQLAALLEGRAPVPEERLALEVALLIQRADVREELDRLTAHIAAARALLAEGGAVGRRLDFLCQEFHREANTTCSKAAELGLTRIGLALKAAIEQLREQIQNIE